MDNMLVELMDIEDALSKMKYSDLYSSSMALYKAMNYPVAPIGNVFNCDINQFIFLRLNKNIQYNSDELYYLKCVDSISMLFNIETEKSKERKYDSDKITFLAIDLDCSHRDRSQYGSYLTQIISKAYSNRVFILFRQSNSIMFSGIIRDGISEFCGKVYLSDWYNCSRCNHEQILLLCRLSFENQKFGSICELYYDMLFSISREYMTYRITYVEIEKFPNLLDLTYDDIKEKMEEGFSFYKNIYGDDYIDSDEMIELLLPENVDWLLQELDELPLEEIEEVNDEENKLEDYEYYLSQSIDEECFENPVKMLEWLDSNNI